MNKPLAIAVALLLVIGLGVLAFSASIPTTPIPQPVSNTSTSTEQTVATSTPVQPQPNEHTGTVSGSVTLSPICPVERIPPDPQCAPKPYQTMIMISSAQSNAQVSSNAAGAFSIALAPGTYVFKPMGGGKVPPTCREQTVTVVANQAKTVNFDCDTGIR